MTAQEEKQIRHYCTMANYIPVESVRRLLAEIDHLRGEGYQAGVYVGTRQDWIDRCMGAEAKLEDATKSRNNWKELFERKSLFVGERDALRQQLAQLDEENRQLANLRIDLDRRASEAEQKLAQVTQEWDRLVADLK